ncbi:sugar transferase [Jatrophihabitans sp.]|uniref:sugar transferase n=1 Tax=Jatrophihabitans sp. TaxID=1932789 RepID=UPI002CC0ECED|nr:sugar transferase [Jatrophihabitans sp.]
MPGPRGLAVAGGSGPGVSGVLEQGAAEVTPALPESFSPALGDWTDASTLEPAPDDTRASRRRSRWLRQYQGGLLAADLLTAWLAVGIAYLLRFGMSGSPAPTVAVVAALPLAWVALVSLNHGYHPRLVGVGAAEFQRIFRAFLHLAALISFTSFVTHADLARGFVLVALPLALVLNLVARYAARKWLHAQRARGRALKSVLLVGDAEAITKFSMVLRRDQYAGLRVAGACVPSELVADSETIDALAEADVPLLGDVDSIVSAVRLSGADTVAVVSSGALGPEKLRWVSWQLEGSSTELVVSPGLTEVAGPRLHILPVAGLPLLHVDEPKFTGFRRVLKGAFDRSLAAFALVLLSPLFLVLALAVRLTSSGPALFRQIRVGRAGSTFVMLKFRSMYADAEERLASLREQSDHGDGVLFKMREDPRVTRVGKFLRKYSLDELPQLINVVRGTMSLVGPRPPLPLEVARYEDHVHRRLLVKPGLTGLWQISGRSDLSWDESVQLDLRYVENWSLSEDLFILWKTVRAVARGSGAY